MVKTKYNKQAKQYERSILINGVSSICISQNKKFLESLPYRLCTEQPLKPNKSVQNKK